MKKTVDVAVIGAGTAGLTARRAAEKEGASTVLIDPGPLGTTCARVGCMPSKLLIAAADAAHHASQAKIFGVEAEFKVHGARVMERVRSERDRFVASVMPAIEDLKKRGLFIEAAASFIGPGRLKAGDDEITAKAVVIACGTKAVIPEPYRALGELLLTYENVFELSDLPKSLLVVGTGIIGLELGLAFHDLGTRVRFLGRGGTVGPLKDPAVKKEAREIFSSRTTFHTEHKLKEVKKAAGGAEIIFEDETGKEIRDSFERVLIAAGRRPDFKSLGVEKADISLDKEGRVEINPETLQAGDLPVFIAGDASGIRELLHEAAHEGHIAGRNAARFPDVKPEKRKVPLTIVFTRPQIAVVGSGWREEGGFCAGEIDYDKQGRSQVMAVNQGIVRVYGSGNPGRLTGAEMLGPAVEHTAHLLSWAIQNEMTLEQIRRMPFYHPVIEEGIQTALEKLWANMKETQSLGRACDEYGPGT